MFCRRLHDELHDLFGNVDLAKYRDQIIAASQEDRFKPIFNDERLYHAVLHAAGCNDCLDDILKYLEIRDKIDYRQFSCIHLAYYSFKKDARCIDHERGNFSIILSESNNELRAIGIGFCPWCGLPLPGSRVEMEEAQALGIRRWQREQIKDYWEAELAK